MKQTTANTTTKYKLIIRHLDYIFVEKALKYKYRNRDISITT